MVQTINPATGQVMQNYEERGADWLEGAVARADTAYGDWGRRPLSFRMGSVQRLEVALKREREALARKMAEEMGKPLKQGLAEVDKSAHTLRVLKDQYPLWLKAREYRTASGHDIRIRPLGPLLGIMPWNFPLWQVIRFAVPALLNGNTILLKHAPNTWGVAELIERLFCESFPDHTYIHLPISIEFVPKVIGDARVRGVSLTGSRRAGSAVAELCGRHIKKCVLELGGSDAYIILEDADVDLAAQICADARLQNTGQSCIAAKRFICHKKHLESFREKLVAKMAQKKVGDPLSPDTDLGPMARADLRAELHRQVTESIARGARLDLGGEIPSGPGFYYPPTALSDVKPGMPAFDEELFGPAAALIEAANDREALRLANLSPYGLGGAIFSKDKERARALATDEFSTGMVAINDFVRSDVMAPFGGIKDSGLGRELGADGCFEFVNIKTVK